MIFMIVLLMVVASTQMAETIIEANARQYPTIQPCEYIYPERGSK
jgi:hypothetical protein